jgi:ubiquinone biosynthesis protein COQ4
MLNRLIGKARFVRAYITAARDFSRLDALLDIAQNAQFAGPAAEGAMLSRPEVQAYMRRPLPPLALDRAALGRLPAGTLGRSFVEFLDAQGIDPENLKRRSGTPERDRGRELVGEHRRKTHDLWHVLTGFETDVAGELGLQAFNQAQLGGPASLAFLSAGYLNALLRAPEDAGRRMDAIVRGWSLGVRARPLFGVDWAALWATPIAEVRRRFGLDPEAKQGANGISPTAGISMNEVKPGRITASTR